MKEFPWDIKLEDSWFEWTYGKYQEVIKQYNSARIKLENLEHEATKPIPCKSWVKDYFFGDEPAHMATLWSEIDEYIKEQSKKDGWTYSHVGTEQIDVNDDPWDDYENLTNQYTVYAIVENKEDFKESNEYQTQYKAVKVLYEEVMMHKNRIDAKLKKVN